MGIHGLVRGPGLSDPGFGSVRGLLSSCRPIRLPFLFHCLAQGPERRGGPCPPRCYGDVEDGARVGAGVGVGDGLADGGGVRRGFTVGDGVGDGVGVGDGSAVALGDGAGVALGSATLGSAETAGLAEGTGVGAGVATGFAVGAGVATTAGGVSAGAVDRTMVGVGVMSGATVTRGVGAGADCVKYAEASTNAPPRNATVMTATMSVPVVRTAPRKTCLLRSPSHERWSCRRARSAMAAA
jgi:hypothetical protein